MSPGFLIFCSFSVAAMLGGGLLAYRWARPRGRVHAVVAGVLAVGLCALSWPIPIHGGVMFLGEAIVDELVRDAARKQEARVQHARTERRARLAARFAGVVAYQTLEDLPGDWSLVRTDAQPRVYRDTRHGLLWSDWQSLPSEGGRPSLEQAKAACRGLAPTGFWALPTEAEHCVAREAGAAPGLEDRSVSSISYIADADLGTELPTYRLGASGTGQRRDAPAPFAVRCVARTERAPAGGYAKRDLSTSRWNRCQLAK